MTCCRNGLVNSAGERVNAVEVLKNNKGEMRARFQYAPGKFGWVTVKSAEGKAVMRQTWVDSGNSEKEGSAKESRLQRRGTV